MQEVGAQWVCYMRHPISRRMRYIPLGSGAHTAEKKLEHLNAVFLNSDLWHDLPNDFPPDLREIWIGEENKVSTDGKTVKQGKTEIPVDADELVAARAEVTYYKQQYESVLVRIRALEKEIVHWRGRRLKIGGISKTLEQAKSDWIEQYKGRDSEHTAIVGYDLNRFVEHFGPKTKIDDMVGREADIDSWLFSLTVKPRGKGKGDKQHPPKPISAGRRAQIRRSCLRLLEDSGCTLNRKAVKPVKRSEIRRDRGGIRWLEAKSADALHKHLPAPWSHVFQIQREIGLRPSEVPTLKRTDFAPDLHTLTLSPVPRTELTLKTGPRTIGIHRYPGVLEVFKELLRGSEEDLLFTHEGNPWNLSKFMKEYREALKSAAKSAGIKTKMDARIGRRTCASTLLRNGKSVEQVAALLGDDPKTVREHYAAILPHEV